VLIGFCLIEQSAANEMATGANAPQHVVLFSTADPQHLRRRWL
jgi:hypothetical protein